jgi:hypothetical protein
MYESSANPAGRAVAGEYSTPCGVLRQTKTHHFRPIPSLTSGCVSDGNCVPPAILSVQRLVHSGGVHGPGIPGEVTPHMGC